MAILSPDHFYTGLTSAEAKCILNVLQIILL